MALKFSWPGRHWPLGSASPQSTLLEIRLRPHTASRPMVVSLTRRDEDDVQWGYWALHQAKGANSRGVRQNRPSACRDGIFLHLRKRDAAAEWKRNVNSSQPGNRDTEGSTACKRQRLFAWVLGEPALSGIWMRPPVCGVSLALHALTSSEQVRGGSKNKRGRWDELTSQKHAEVSG